MGLVHETRVACELVSSIVSNEAMRHTPVKFSAILLQLLILEGYQYPLIPVQLAEPSPFPKNKVFNQIPCKLTFEPNTLIPLFSVDIYVYIFTGERLRGIANVFTLK